jgi:hypothetical protein
MTANPTASATMDQTIELPRPWRLVRSLGWSLAEAVGLPLGAYLAAHAIAGSAAGLLAGLAAVWATVVVRKLVTGKVPGLLMISAVMLCLQTALVLATGQVWIYLLQFPAAKLVLSLLFARSAPTGRPLIARLAAEMTSLRHNCHENSGLHRYFRGATWLWAGIFALLAVVFAVLVATVPIASFLLTSSAIYVGVIGTGAAVSALWFFAVLRRHGLRLRLMPS